MSSIVTAITGGNGQGDAYKPASTNILQPANEDQANQLYGQVQQGLTNQQGFVNAVNAQNGLGNQQNVYNQLQGVANGTGPNPAQTQLNQSTGANVANQAALMAGQRGSGANAGLIARQAAMQGANTQQQAAGQGATMQANQSLNAMNQLGTIATNQVQQQANANNSFNTAAQGAQQNTLGAIGAQNNANVGMQSNVNSVNGGLNTAISGQQGALIGNLTSGIGAGLVSSFADGGEVDANSIYGQSPDTDNNTAATGDYSPGVTDNTQDQDTIAGQQAAYATPAPQQSMDQTKAALSAAIPISGNIPKVSATPGPASNVGRQFMQQQNSSKPADSPAPTMTGGGGGAGANPLGMAGSFLGKGAGNFIGQGIGQVGSYLFGGQGAADFGALAGGAGDAVGAAAADPAVDDAAIAVLAAKGGPVKAMVSPGEKYLTPQAAKAVAAGKADPMKAGKTVPGKPKVKGAKNSYANDTVPATLEEGGIVLPRSVTQGKNPEWAAHKFVRDVMAKKGLR